MANANMKFVTPKGVAQYPWLTKPDTKFSEEGVYKVSLAIPEADAKAFAKAAQDTFVNEYGQAKLSKAHMPFKKDEDGNLVFSFKSKLKPRLYDSAGKPITEDVAVGGGSVLKVSGAFGPYNKGANMGVALYLNAVQIIELVEFSSNPFGAVEGGFVASAEEDTFAPADASDEEVQF
jgi:hypothetical protein